MAERRISTRLALEGEAEYRSKMSEVNASLREMQSALKLADAECKNTGNSQAALTQKGEALNNLLTAQRDKVTSVRDRLESVKTQVQAYKDKIEGLNLALKKNEAALERTAKESGTASEEYKKLQQENERLKGEIDKANAGLKTAEREVKNLGTALNKAKTDVKGTETAIEQNTDALNRHGRSVRADAEALNALAAALIASGLKRGLEEIAETLKACVDASVGFESAMAGVAKTTDMGDRELSAMGDEIKKLSTEIPITTTELAGIVEVAGQLGVEKDSLVGFATVMANLGVATNMTSEEAATMLARFATVTGMSPAEYSNLGSAIVALGNSFATTEGEITQMSQRLAASGTIAGLSEPEILALATAMSSVGIQAEAGGTAMSQTLTQISKFVDEGGVKLDTLSSVAGMSAESFAEAWRSKPAEALEAFIRGLGSLDEEAESTNQILDELGMAGVRQGNMLKSLSLAADTLSGALSMSNTAWEGNAALVREAETRYGTTESKIQMFKNSVSNLKIAVGDQLTPALGDLAETGTDVLSWASKIVQENKNLVPILTAVTAAISTVTAGIAGFAIISKIIPLIKALNLAMAANPAFLIATGIAAVTAAAVTLIATLPSATKEADALNDKLKDSKTALSDAKTAFEDTNTNIEATALVAEKYIAKLEELDKKTHLTAEEQDVYNSTVNQLKQILPDMDYAIDETTGKLKTSTDELRAGAQAWVDYAREKALATMFNEQLDAITELQVGLATAELQMEEFNATTTQGMLDYVAAREKSAEASAKFSKVLEESSYQETAAVKKARLEVEDARLAASDAYDELSRAEQDQIEAMDALSESMASTKEEIDQQSEALQNIQSKLDEYSSKVEDAAVTTAELAEDTTTANEQLATLGDGTAENLQQIPEGMQTAIEETVEIITTGKETVITTASDMGTQAAEGFQTELGGMNEATTQVLSDVHQNLVSATPTAYDDGYSIGVNIAEGMELGIMDYAAQVAQAAADMVEDAILAAKAAADVNSPSRKMIVLGKALDEGLVVGIKALEDDVIQTMAGTLGKVTTMDVEAPTIPYAAEVALSTIDGATRDSKGGGSIQVTQIINAENTSYIGQQREAARRMKKLARELNR